MPKFKIGDEVEVVRRIFYGEDDVIGHKFIIFRIDNSHGIEHPCYFPEDENGVYEPNLELVFKTWKERFK